jgi:hypothetical protein
MIVETYSFVQVTIIRGLLPYPCCSLLESKKKLHEGDATTVESYSSRKAEGDMNEQL